MYLGDLRIGAIFKIEGEPKEYRIHEIGNFAPEQVWGDMFPRRLKNVVYAVNICSYPEQIHKFHPEQPVVVINDG